MITLKMKPRGKMKTSCDPTTLSSFHRGNYPTPARLFGIHCNLRVRFSLRGEGCNTPCYGSPNLTLITIISNLVVHDATGLINLESSLDIFYLI
jgi:hypothetical protein